MGSCARPAVWSIAAVALIALVPSALADQSAQPLPFAQSWTDINMITNDDNWNFVPGIVGYRGDGLTAGNGTDPQTILADGSGTPIDVNANQTNPNVFATGGLAEFHLADPVVALNGSTTAAAPHLVLHLNTTGVAGISVSYNLRDLDGSADDAQQQVALHYRIGFSGDYTNIPAAYVSDATTGGTATQVTNVNVTLPAAAGNQPAVQLRIMTTNAAGNDEWVGVDDISVTSPPTAVRATSLSATRSAKGVVLRWRTGFEVGALGFHVYRTKNGTRLRLSRLPIRASGGLRGHVYRFLDRRSRSGSYWLQEIRADGSRSWYGPVTTRIA